VLIRAALYVVVPDYQGQRHTVTVGREGFEWQGTTYASLSAIARAITGTPWSGPDGVERHAR